MDKNNMKRCCKICKKYRDFGYDHWYWNVYNWAAHVYANLDFLAFSFKFFVKEVESKEGFDSLNSMCIFYIFLHF